METSSDGQDAPPRSVSPGGRRYATGDVIGGKFLLKSVIGEGGMGAVWLARNTVLEVDVAIKLIRHGIASPEASERLLQEARAAARLEHPSILRIFDFGATDAGDPYIAMEMLRGESLAQILDVRGRISATEAVRILLPVASAVCAAHSKGIVHRDLKPDNVLLTENDAGTLIPKVVDFGIAKVREEGMAYRSLTRAGAILGSPDYMCPEQARGRNDVDEKCDVWALSVMLYECVVGRRPFNGENYNALITSIIEDEPTPITELAAGDEGLWEIIASGLAKTAAGRPSMRTLGERLAQWASQNGVDTDVSGGSLALWFTAPPRESMASLPEPSERPRVTSSRPRDMLTHAGEPLGPTQSSTTSPPVASSSPKWPLPGEQRKRRAGLVVVGALVAASVAVALAVTKGTAVTMGNPGGVAQTPPVSPGTSGPGTSGPRTSGRVGTSVSLGASGSASSAPEVTPDVRPTASPAAASTGSAAPSAHAGSGPHVPRVPPAAKPPPSATAAVKVDPLAVPAAPNF